MNKHFEHKCLIGLGRFLFFVVVQTGPSREKAYGLGLHVALFMTWV